jgi:DNA-binding response OmpR family regulator
VRLLLVDDEVELASALHRALVRERHAVDLAPSVADAVAALVGTTYDLVLLDVGLPDGDGFDVLARIRSGELAGPDPTAAPRVLMLTGRGGLGERVHGLDAGADDYVVKPFELHELLARVRALLRRDVAGTGSLVAVGDLTVDVARHEARRAGREVALSPKEFAVLAYLMTRPGRVVSSEELLEHVWDAHADPFTATVRVTVGTLRRKLGDDGEGDGPIETVRRLGYRLREPVGDVAR